MQSPPFWYTATSLSDIERHLSISMYMARRTASQFTQEATFIFVKLVYLINELRVELTLNKFGPSEQ